MALTQPPSPARTELENKLNSQKAEMDRQLLQSAQEILQLRIVSIPRPLVKNAYQNINFLISQPKHTLWVLQRTVSMRRFF